MAIEERVQYALDNFLKAEIFESQKETYELLEEDDFGKARIFFNVGNSDSICVKNYDRIPDWEILRKEKKFHMRKSIDHFILRKITDIWELHMIEIKKTASPNTWQDVKLQMGVSYLKIKALLTFLGISIQDENIFMYTAYSEDKLVAGDSQSEGVTAKTFKTGEQLINPKVDEWDAGFIYIPLINSDGNIYLKKFKHIKIQLFSSSDEIPEGTFTLH